MVTSLTTGDTIHVGDSVKLTALAVEGKRVSLGVESSESDGPGKAVVIEERKEPYLNWWELN